MLSLVAETLVIVDTLWAGIFFQITPLYFLVHAITPWPPPCVAAFSVNLGLMPSVIDKMEEHYPKD